MGMIGSDFRLCRHPYGLFLFHRTIKGANQVHDRPSQQRGFSRPITAMPTQRMNSAAHSALWLAEDQCPRTAIRTPSPSSRSIAPPGTQGRLGDGAGDEAHHVGIGEHVGHLAVGDDLSPRKSAITRDAYSRTTCMSCSMKMTVVKRSRKRPTKRETRPSFFVGTDPAGGFVQQHQIRAGARRHRDIEKLSYSLRNLHNDSIGVLGDIVFI